MTPLLTVGVPGSPWFGPRVFDDASRCPASAAVRLRGYRMPVGATSEQAAKSYNGPWFAAVTLLRELAHRGPTSAYVAGQHPVRGLGRLAATLLRRESRSTREFAVTAIENLLEAQAATSHRAFDHYPTFVKMPFGAGEMHAGGVFVFRGPAGAWQVWRLRMATARPADRASRGWALIAAFCLAGHLDHERQERLQAVDAFEAGAADGCYEPLGAWTRNALDADFAALRTGRLAEMAADLRVSGGSHCADCLFVGNCPAAPRIESLLHYVPGQPTVRKITATDLRAHADCARRYQLLLLHNLPAEPATGEALLHGRNIDTWLHANHVRGHACREPDIHRLLTETGDQVAADMAARHLAICPLAATEAAGLTAQPYVAALDASSRILLVARPDAIYWRNGNVVWRETKTHTVLSGRSAQNLVETDTAAAMYFILLASGATGPADALEWEELTAGGQELTILPADDKDLVEAACAHVSAAVADLLADKTHPPRLGPHCTCCPVRTWCPDVP